MARRIYGNGPIASVAHIQTVETILGQIRIAFVPKQDPFEELAREIEVRKQVLVPVVLPFTIHVSSHIFLRLFSFGFC